ncbi:MAG: tetratricopeptide repeat protein [Gammaproteobacteria bacterium]|nr:tetratricopeptide repeat protein [Gammaproteobacteria bacterium]
MQYLDEAGKYIMTIILKSILLAFMVVSLFSCAGVGSAVKPAVDEKIDTTTMASKDVYVEVDPDVNSDFMNAIKLMQGENYAQAISVLNTVIEREKRLPAPYVNIAIAYNKLGNNKAAEQNLISALKLDISQPVANNELGLLYRKQGRFKAARVAYENALREYPEYLSVIRNLGVLCDLYLHDYDCALQQYENYLDLKPDDKTVLIWVADVKQRLAK